MKKNSLVSIIIPSYNQGDYILGALDSILAQNYPHIEIIIIDGKSTDNTIRNIQSYTSRIEKVIIEKDSGTSEAINKGFNLANGEYLWILNCDDELFDNTVITRLVDCYKSDPKLEFVYGDMLIINDSGKKMGRRVFPDYNIFLLLTDRRHLPWPGCLLKKSVIEHIGLLDTSLKYSNDLDFFLRIFNRQKTFHLKKETGIFRIHDKASTQVNVKESGQESVQVCNRFISSNINSLSKNEKTVYQEKSLVFQISYNFNSGNSYVVRNKVISLWKKNPGYLLHPKIWLYFGGAILGDKGMVKLSFLLRKLIQNYFIYFLNNILSK